MDVTVVIPFKRGGNKAWLKQAIGSLPEGTKYLVLENDAELVEALNEGVKAAETEWVFRLDADDAVGPKTLDFLHDLAWDVDVTYPSLALADEELKPFEYIKAPAFCPHRLKVWNYIPGCALFRRSAFLEVGGYRDLDILEDWDLWLRMSEAGFKFKAVPEAEVAYRQHGKSRNKVFKFRYEEIRDQLKSELADEDLKASFYYQATYATTYWRCLLPARYLPGQAVDYPEYRIRGDDIDFPSHRGAAVWQFPGDGARAVQMAAMQEDGVRVLVEADDSYFEKAPYGNAWGENLGDGPHTREAHRKILPWVDGIIVTTPHLAKRYRKFNQNVYVCPNQLDPEDWAEPEKDDILQVGWFASPSHRDDARLVKNALEWASKQDGVEVVTMGLDPGWNFRRRHYPWTNDMGVYRKLIQTLDIGVAPVVETPWASCRSDVKALEYSAAGAYPVVSESIPYENFHGPCIKAKTGRDFLDALISLIRNRDELPKLQKEAREYVLTERTVEKNVWRWEEACTPP